MPQVIFDPRYVWTNPLAANPLAANPLAANPPPASPPAASPPEAANFIVYRAEDTARERQRRHKLRYMNPLFRCVSKFLDRAVTRTGVSMVFVPLKATTRRDYSGSTSQIDLAGRPLDWTWEGLDPVDPSAYCHTCAFCRVTGIGGPLCVCGSKLVPGFRDWYSMGLEAGWTLCRASARGDGIHGVWRAVGNSKVYGFTSEKSLAEKAGIVQKPYPRTPRGPFV